MKSVSHVHQQLFTWWQKEGRVLPWRRRASSEIFSDDTPQHVLREKSFQSYFAGHLLRDPYQVVVAELMLQQTQVDRVMPKYEAWMSKWPTVADLSRATLAEVLIFWQGLGYNRRARFLWLMSKEIVEKRQGIWPNSEEELLQLPGIGKYTARAVMSFALGQQVGVVDTNVKRILERVFGQQLKSEKEFFVFADSILPPNQADPWNQALMDFGALICTAKNPKCKICPLKNDCSVNVDAIKEGYENYSEYLKVLNSSKKENAQKKIRFEDTDRYFRGRIMDELRGQHLTKKELSQIMVQQHGLMDEVRLEKLIKDLEKEGLITQHGEVFQIGS